jgi:hypothetical protein
MSKKNNFWRDVYQESRKRVREQLGVKGDALKLAMVIIFTALSVSVLSVFGLLKLFGINDDIPKIIWALFGGEIAFVIILLISEPIYAFFKMFSVAAEMNIRLLETQEGFARYLKSGAAILLITQEINQNDWVGIRVINNENRFIEGVIKIESIPESRNFSDSLELKRHGIANNDTFKLSRDSHNDFDVAMMSRGKVIIPHHGGIHSFEITPGEYNLETHLIAEFKDPPQGLISPKIEYWRLIYDPSANPILQLKKVSDVFSQIKIKDKKAKGSPL